MKRLAVLVAIVCVSALFASPAFATDGETIPHGGFSASTDTCLQCHDIHEAAGDYVLMRQATMTAVCGSCHTLYQEEPTGAYDPGYSGTSASTVATAAVYKVPIGEALNHNGHRLGLGSGNFVFADGNYGDGSYIPGGTNAVTAIAYLGYPDQTVAATNFATTNGLSCASCHAPHGTYGNVLPLSVSDKILSSKPNHAPAAISLTTWVDDGGKWCASCHDKRVQADHYPTNPDYTCLTCHGDWLDPPDLNPDFPHTGKVPSILAN